MGNMLTFTSNIVFTICIIYVCTGGQGDKLRHIGVACDQKGGAWGSQQDAMISIIVSGWVFLGPRTALAIDGKCIDSKHPQEECQMRRVSSSNVLVVSPFEVAWVSDDSSAFSKNAGCISFEARGENDATVILRSAPGTTKRIQQLEHSSRESDSNDLYEPHYTVIFGSHQNSCLKIERNSQECFRWDNAARVNANKFTPCWISFDRGKFSMGAGIPGSGTAYTWEDPMPIEDVKHVGLGSWNTYVCFKNIKLQPLYGPSRRPCQEGEDNELQEKSVPSLAALCKRAALQHISVSNICPSLLHVELLTPQLDDIGPQLLSYLAQHLGSVMKQDPESFCELGEDMIAELLAHPYVDCQESVLLNALLLWAFQEPSPLQSQNCRLQQDAYVVQSLLSSIRFPLLRLDELQTLADSNLVHRMPGLQDHVLAELKGQMLLQHARQGFHHRRRFLPPTTHLMFVSSGDGNGVIHWLGTTYGKQAWMNPLLGGIVKVEASSPSCKHTDARPLVSFLFQRLNFAGPGRLGTWWKIDLGERHRCIVNYYTIRHDGSTDYPRNWSLQGSIDGEGWVNLKEHVNDVSISKSGQMVSWPVSSHAASLPYRMFRLLLTGPNASASRNRMTFHLSMLELYGQFFLLN